MILHKNTPNYINFRINFRTNNISKTWGVIKNNLTKDKIIESPDYFSHNAVTLRNKKDIFPDNCKIAEVKPLYK